MPESDPQQLKPGRSRRESTSLPKLAADNDSISFPVAAIGASAGGLDACSKLLDALPPDPGMAFILVQHLDPTHESMMADLLASHTAMTVSQAVDGVLIERNHLYIIPPGAYLSVSNGAIYVSPPAEHHGARLPFDFLLHTLAKDLGPRAICLILSGTGGDGSIGLKAVKEHGGLVIAQAPDEASFDGMPRSAIATGMVDLVLGVKRIPEALAKHQRDMGLAHAQKDEAADISIDAVLPAIIDLLHARTGHDFSLYKLGTLQRRTERRMAMAALKSDDMAGYLDLLRGDDDELQLLAKDLLINVTSFFRDPKTFALLAEKYIPALLANRTPDQPIRIWVVGCSTGEETYSLAMLFFEKLASDKSALKLQIFASDLDADAIASAREGLYAPTIEADVSPERLARFFTREEGGYRIAPELRAAVVFTVQDVLTDPPFSRLDLITCRNLLIYLRPEAQAKALSLFHFALREGGLLLLGSAETVGVAEGRFEVLAKAERIYRRVGRSRVGDLRFGIAAESARTPLSGRPNPMASQPSNLAELCRSLLVENYAPASVLINAKFECLYFIGPTDRYLRVAPGLPQQDVFSMAREGVRNKLRSAIQQARLENRRVVVTGGRLGDDAEAQAFSIAVQPALHDGEQLLLASFIDEPRPEPRTVRAAREGDAPRIVELEQELDATRIELEHAVRSLEIANEEQKAINEEALSVNEEYQSTNEELLTSKEELQSLNEELTALNSQLHETLERQRATSNDLRNVLYSTDVATIFLDPDLNIRLFTPATRLLFGVIPGDVGRPLSDLNSLANDTGMLEDCRAVLKTAAPIERDVEARTGAWYTRHVLPYRAENNTVEGVVITYVDTTERRQSARAIDEAKQQALLANKAKSRFLAIASHDLRQPLQSLTLIQGLLAKTVEGDKARQLVARLDESVGVMSRMLNALLDINQIEAGTVQAEAVIFPINDILQRLHKDFAYQAQAQRLTFKVVASSAFIHSDPRLLEQMIRNLLSNALKYTKQGKILLGCRRRNGALSIELWDTGIGIPVNDLQAIFDEYHQIDNTAREHSRGFGLGLSIVKRLAALLGHHISVRSHLGAGSVFAIEVAVPASSAISLDQTQRDRIDDRVSEAASHGARILVVEDDPELCELLQLLLEDEGHRVTTASNGAAALEWVSHESIRPDLLLADYNLPNGMSGLQLAAKLRETFYGQLPVIILTGDITTETLRNISANHCVRLNKPVKPTELMLTIQTLRPAEQHAAHPPAPGAGDVQPSAPPVIFVVDDDAQLRNALRGVLEDDGLSVRDFASSEDFLAAYQPEAEACLLVDAYLPGMSGLELLRRLHDDGHRLPAIMITGHSDVAMAVDAMKAGACDFIEKPVGCAELLASIGRALERSRSSNSVMAWRETAAKRLAELTPRQRQIMDMVLAGHPSKNIAADLGISQRTVENHRAEIMKRTGSKSIPDLTRVAFAAAEKEPD